MRCLAVNFNPQNSKSRFFAQRRKHTIRAGKPGRGTNFPFTAVINRDSCVTPGQHEFDYQPRSVPVSSRIDVGLKRTLSRQKFERKPPKFGA
jgi:hypothetical protein